MRRGKESRTYLPIVAFAFVLMLLANATSNPLQASLKNLVFDQYERWRPRPYEFDQPVRIVDIDDESIERIGQWPWPRRKMADMVDALVNANVAAISLNVLFSEKERSTPGAFVAANPQAAGTYNTASEPSSEGDEAFATAISGRNVVLGSILTTRDLGGDATPKVGAAALGGDPVDHVPAFAGLLGPVRKLADSASGIGFMNWTPDADRVVRQMPLLASVRGKLEPSFVLESLRVAQGASNYVVKTGDGKTGASGSTGIAEIRDGAVIIETQPSGDIRTYFAPMDPRRTLPAWKLFEKGADLSDLAGKLVVVGASASLLSDVVATPLNPSTPGVEAVAQLIEQILSGVTLRRPDWAPGAELVSAIVLSVALVVAMPVIPAFWSGLLGAVAAAVLCGVSWYAFTQHGILLDPVVPSLSSAVVFLAGILTLYSQKRQQVTEIRSAFGRYVSPAVVAQLAEQPEKLKLGGLQRRLTVMFCDIRSFTTISEGFSAAELIHFLNEYLTPMTTVILDETGTVDKYMGDAIMAFWNAPLDDPDHAGHAVRAALRMRAALVELNRNWAKQAEETGRPFGTVKFGVGLNTGDCSVGNMGSHQRFDYSAMGDEVNVASRLEGASKVFGVDIVASASTRSEAADFAWLEIDLVRLKGRTQATPTYALAGDTNYAASPGFKTLAERHEAMLAAYRRRDFVEAHGLAGELAELAPAEVKGLFGFYSERLTQLAASSLGETWRPMITLTEK